MTYGELILQIEQAKAELAKHLVRPEVIKLSPSAFNLLAENTPNRPTVCGLEIRVVDRDGGDPWFAVKEREWKP